MTVKTQGAGKGLRRTGLFNFILALILITLIFLIYKQMNVEALGQGQAGDGNGQNHASEGYTVLEMDEADMGRGDLVLVNKEHPYSFPEDLKLVSIYDHKKECYFVRDKNVLLDKSVMKHLNGIMEGFYNETGVHDVNVVAGHRTYDFQQKLYDNSLAVNGPEHTAQYIALPGCSEHHTGLAVDFSIFHLKTGDSAEFDGGGDYGWIRENAWKYGFVQRFTEAKTSITYVADEPWHFRYVGVAHAYYMEQNDLCLEEYIGLLRQYPFVGEHLLIECAGEQYEVYYCPGTEVQVPEKGAYTLSGNNVDGFIVTVETDKT